MKGMDFIMARGYVRKRGNGWYYVFDTAPIDGKRQRVEHRGGDTKPEAEDALRKAMEEYDRGGIQVQLSNISVADYFDYWYQQYVVKELKRNTQLNYLNIITKYIKPEIGIYKIQNMNIAALQRMFDKLGTSGLAKHTVEIIGTVVKNGFKMAVFPYQIIKDNPAVYIRMPRFALESNEVTRESLHLITLSQYHEILEIYPPAHLFHMPLVLAFNTGMRRGEVCALTWDKVDLDAGTIRIDKNMAMFKNKEIVISTPKTPASIRTIMIGQVLIDELKAKRKAQMENRIRYRNLYVDNNNFVCTHEDGSPVTPHSIKHYSEKVQKLTDINFKFHSLRHTHATMLLENGAEPKEIQVRLGHSKLETTMNTYVHVTQKMEKNTINIMDSIQGKRPAAN
ncbi:tyrosine-type recombinase/integrase [Paucilactobacillus nenjiangensis]|nr:tyrosine-type recombinase/integrase [Paucilactobacillus nenjiangensis]